MSRASRTISRQRRRRAADYGASSDLVKAANKSRAILPVTVKLDAWRAIAVIRHYNEINYTLNRNLKFGSYANECNG
jgi:hypothetical protein